jgi:hypothetical protein
MINLMDETLRQHIIEELALTEVTTEEANEIISDVGELIMEMVILHVAESLSDDKAILFEKLIAGEDASDKQEKVSLFLEENVPNLEDIVASCSEEVVEEYKKAQQEV